MTPGRGPGVLMTCLHKQKSSVKRVVVVNTRSVSSGGIKTESLTEQNMTFKQSKIKNKEIKKKTFWNVHKHTCPIKRILFQTVTVWVSWGSGAPGCCWRNYYVQNILDLWANRHTRTAMNGLSLNNLLQAQVLAGLRCEEVLFLLLWLDSG